MSDEGGTQRLPRTNPGLPAVRPEMRQPARPRMPSGFSSVRDILSFIAGLGIISNEVFFSDKVEVAILTVGVALAGLPVVFGADERRKPPPPASGPPS